MTHVGGSIMVLACLAVTGPRRLAIIDETMNSELYPQILKENIRIFVQNWILRENGSLYYYKLFYKRMVKEEQS